MEEKLPNKEEGGEKTTYSPEFERKYSIWIEAVNTFPELSNTIQVLGDIVDQDGRLYDKQFLMTVVNSVRDGDKMIEGKLAIESAPNFAGIREKLEKLSGTNK
jgi:hypothetical protein